MKFRSLHSVHAARSGRLARVRHLVLAGLLIFAASQTLAQQHFHGVDDLNTCVICAHGDHSPIAQTSADKAPTKIYQRVWNISFQSCPQAATLWPAFQSRAPPSP